MVETVSHCCSSTFASAVASALTPTTGEYVRSLRGDEFADHLIGAEGAEKIPSSYIDFGMLPRGEERLQEAFSVLLKMRRDLAGQRLHFAVFDFVCIGYLYLE